MCGIIGYTGREDSLPYLLGGLRALEYRGYDSAGIAVSSENGIITVKTRGRIDALEEKIKICESAPQGHCGIGHTRWATHGAPSDVNSHPHRAENLALVHNGIIENYSEIEDFLKEKGYIFESDTDTERAAKLIDYFFVELGDPVKAIFEATEKMRGSYAFGVIFDSFRGKMFAIRKDSPLIVAKGKTGCFIASDIPAILGEAVDCYQLQEGIIAVLSDEKIDFVDKNGVPSQGKKLAIDLDVEQAKKGGFPHFMLKEIHEEPEAVRKTVSAKLGANLLPFFGTDILDSEKITKFKKIHIVACGTAMHAGLIGKNVIEKLARIPCEVDIASEFRYRDPILGKDDLVVLLSQSGETADTLAALRHAKSKGVYTLSIVNVIGSSVARESDSVLYTLAGPEISVASTKAYSVQCALLYLFAIRLATANKKISENEAKRLCTSLLSDVPNHIESALKLCHKIKAVSEDFLHSENLFFIGRGIDSALCSEASLKLKEISYIHSEAYAAGELKHGTISLISEGTPVIAIMTVTSLAEKMISGIREVSSRGARVLTITTKEIAEKFSLPTDNIITVDCNEEDEIFAPFAVTTCFQMLAYHVSALRGNDVDKPRNLAKSVTVE